MYNTITDARTVLINSGCIEWFDFDKTPMDDVAEYMYRNDATVEQAAEYFEAA